MARARSTSLLVVVAGVALSALVPLGGCSDRDKGEAGAERRALPPLEFRDDTAQLFLTWIDKRGDTHVEQSTKFVPDEHKGFVRVVVGDQGEGSDPIYVADISRPADGQYTAHSVPRSEWEDEIDKRRKNAPEVASEDPRPRRPPREQPPRDPRPPAEPPKPGPSGAPAEPDGKLDPSFSHVQVTIYGAKWCGACHAARSHLRKKGVKTVWKDIDADPAAKVEMKAKLEKAHGREGSIPVIDVNGQILVGFSASQLDRAIRAVGGTAM